MKYKIGEVANVLGTSPDLLRYYEKKGVVTPQKGKYNDYRYYDAWDINFLMDCLWFKNFGLSIEQISDMVRSYSAQDISNMFSSKEDELRSTIKRCQLLLKRSQEYREGMQRLSLLGKCDIDVSPAGVCFLNRHADEFPSPDKLAPFSRQWLELMPFNCRYFEISQSALRGEDDLDYRWGYFLPSDYAEELEFEAEPPMVLLEPQRSIHTVCQSSGKGQFGPKILEHALRYAEENGYTITGPARGILLASVCEEDKLNGYFEVWIPIA